MKYIRIKNGAVAVGDEEYNIKYIISTEDYLTKYFVDSRHIIAQADTIEGLCDEFVVAYEDGSRIVYSDLAWAKTKANASLEFGHKSIIYGAIWTEWGLKYVAKLNDKGELELL